MYEFQAESKFIQDKLTESEEKSRQNNLRIDGVKETKEETWNDSEGKFQHMFTQKLALDGIDIEHAHRQKCNSTDCNRPQTIVMKLLRFKDK